MAVEQVAVPVWPQLPLAALLLVDPLELLACEEALLAWLLLMEVVLDEPPIEELAAVELELAVLLLEPARQCPFRAQLVPASHWTDPSLQLATQTPAELQTSAVPPLGLHSASSAGLGVVEAPQPDGALLEPPLPPEGWEKPLLLVDAFELLLPLLLPPSINPPSGARTQAPLAQA